MPLKVLSTGRNRQRSDLTKALLIEAGASLFARRGFDGITVDEIAREARVNKALINYHFGGKAGLYSAIVESTLAPVTQRLLALRESNQPAPELLREYLRVFREVAEKRPCFPAMVLREALAGGERIEAHILRHFTLVAESVGRILEKGRQEGTLREVDPLLTFLMMQGTMVFFFATVPFRQRIAAEGNQPAVAPAPHVFLKHVEEMLLRALESAPGPPPSKPERRST